jgi:hypothetical protein
MPALPASAAAGGIDTGTPEDHHGRESGRIFRRYGGDGESNPRNISPVT